MTARACSGGESSAWSVNPSCPASSRVTVDRSLIASFGTIRVSPSTISAIPLGNDRKAPSAFRGTGILRRARMTLPVDASASMNRGKSARIDRRSTSPAWIPASNGSAI
jgi:hypothetical protein